jgi:hypothetical protein
MPDIKRTFTKGKMNKDLDERLLPSGEYRDAMNLQVSTSDGSEVGVIQNLLGNSEINIGGIVIADDAVCIGSIADEKTNSIYWFVAESRKRGINKSMILEYKDNMISPVFVHKSLITIPYDAIGEQTGAAGWSFVDPDPDVWLADNALQIFIAASDSFIGNVAFEGGVNMGSLLACYNHDGVDIFLGLGIRAQKF